MNTLGRVLAARDLAEPNGQPLYAYCVTCEEFQELHGELRARVAASTDFDMASAAAFCLVAAEHLSRGDGTEWWSWDPIKAFVGFQGSDADLRDAVRHGLGYWKRPVVRGGTGRQFLGTLVCEGGLPLRLVQDEDARLRRYFRQLLLEHETYPTLEPVELAARLCAHLPARMQNAIVYELAAELVRQVAEMRRQNVTAEEAVGWPVPLRLDADVAREFLEGLRTAPAIQQRREPGIAVRTIVRLGQELLLQREIVLPPKLTAAALQEKLGTKPLPARVDLSLQVVDGTRVRVGIAALQGEGYFVRSFARTVARPESVAGQLLCLGSYGGRELGSFVPTGGTALPATPWIFSDEGGEGVLLSTSILHRRAGSLLIAIPSSGEFDVDGSVEDLGELMGHSRRLLRLRGEFLWTGEDDEVSVSTGQDESGEVAFELRGRRPPALVRETDFWLGCPELWEVPADGGAARRISKTELEWHGSAVASSWRKVDGSTVGAGQLAFRGDDAGFRAFVRILPADFAVRLRCGRGGAGVVELRSGALVAAGVEHATALTADVRLVVGGVDIRVSADPANVPASVVVRLRLAGGGDVPITLPFPAERAAFVGRDGKALDRGTRLSVDELAQVRAVAVTPQQSKWSVDVRAGRGSEHLAHLRVVAEGVHELHLEPVRDALATVLASKADLDDQIELRLVREGVVDGREPCLLVRRYDLALRSRLEGLAHKVEIVRQDAERLPPETVAALRAEAVSMDAPDRVTVQLEREEPGTWSTDNPNLGPGPWLVLVRQGDYLRGRPFRITIPGASMRVPATALESAIAIGERDVRQQRIAEIFAAMVDDLACPEREVVRSQLSMVGRCPAGTFDVVQALTESPVLAVQLLLEAGQRQTILWDGLVELPFDWACIPVSVWLKAIRGHVQHLRTYLPDPALLAGVLESAAPGVFGPTKLAPFLSCIHDAAALTIEGVPAPRDPWVSGMAHPSIPLPFLLHFDEQWQALLQRHADDVWWPPASPFEDNAVDSCRALFAQLTVRFQQRPGFREPVLLTPMVLAAQTLGNGGDADLLRLRRLRAFDPDWFEFAHAFALSLLLGRRHMKKDSPFDD